MAHTQGSAEWWIGEFRRVGLPTTGRLDEPPGLFLWFLRLIIGLLLLLAVSFAVMPLFGGSAYALCVTVVAPLFAVPFGMILSWFTRVEASVERDGIALREDSVRFLIPWGAVGRVEARSTSITVWYEREGEWRKVVRPRMWSGPASFPALGTIAPTARR